MERGKPTSPGYSTSKSPLGPFEYQGIIIDNTDCDPASWNNHGSIECINGQWYVFYHRCSGGVQQYRRLCIEPIEIGANGKIAEVPMTSQGAGKPFAPGEKIMGYQACGLKGSVYIGLDEQYKEALKNISNGDEAIFRYVQSKADWTEVVLTYSGGGKVRVLMNDVIVGTVECKTGEEDVNKVKKNIQCLKGKYELRLEFEDVIGLEIYLSMRYVNKG